MKIVLDTNCLLRIIPKKSKYHSILQALRMGYFTLCYSNEILTEYEEVLARFYNENIADVMVSFLINSPHTEEIIPHYQWHLIYSDQDDNKFVDCAINAGADYIVTNDKHFNVLKNIDFPKINIIDIESFSRIFF